MQQGSYILKKIFIFLLASVFIFSGCSNLRGNNLADSDSTDITEQDSTIDQEEDGYFETDSEQEVEEHESVQEEGSGVSGFFKKIFKANDQAVPDEDGYEEEYEDEDGYEEEHEDEEEYEGDEEDLSEEDAQAESSGGISGFFKRLFGGGEEYEDEEEAEYVEDEDGFSEEDAEDIASEDDQIDGEDDQIDGEENVVIEDSDTQEQSFEANAVTPEAPKNIPLQKIRKWSYQKGSYLVNAVYIARQGEQMADISQKLYGNDQTNILYTINPHLKSRQVKVGDKIYYSSSRKINSDKVVFYYEDIGAPAMTYTISAGQNIRKVSSQLLGHPNSWKEIWATNPQLESKGIVDQDVTISYFPEQQVAQAAPQQEQAPPAQEQMDPAQDAKPDEAGTAPGMMADETNPSDGMMGDEFPPQDLPDQMADMGIDEQNQGVLKEKADWQNLLNLIMKDKKLLAIAVGCLIILILIIRILVKKYRQERDFDYTAF